MKIEHYNLLSNANKRKMPKGLHILPIFSFFGADNIYEDWTLSIGWLFWVTIIYWNDED